MNAVTRLALAVTLAVMVSAAQAQSDEYQEAAKLFRAGQQAQALERVNSFLGSHPKDARARFLKGLILTEQNNAAEAIKIFTGLTEDYPELPEPYNNLAVLYASQGQYDKARTALEMAIRTHPSYATAHENLGDIYAKMASQAYDKALQLDKSNATAQTKLEMIRELFSGTGQRKPGAKGDAAAKPSTQIATAPKAAPPATAPAAPATPPAAKAVPEPAKAAAPAEPAKPARTADPTDDVLKTVNDWAHAWSNNDVPRYLAFYAPDFKTPGGEKRGDWEASRKARIAKPKKIEVSIETPKVKVMDNNRVTVTFRQNYRSATLKVLSTKTLVMVKTGDHWLIQQERAGG